MFNTSSFFQARLEMTILLQIRLLCLRGAVYSLPSGVLTIQITSNDKFPV